MFAGVAPAVLKEWRDQAMIESPSHTRSHPPELMIALLAALVFCRRRADLTRLALTMGLV